MYSVAALYKFSSIQDPEKLHNEIRINLKKHSIYGTILVGKEGINGTISGKEEKLVKAITFIKSIEGFSKIDIKTSKSKVNPFVRLKIKHKKEIVTIGDKSIDPNEMVGDYIEPENWNNLISDKNTILIDTRNDYEYSIGTFKNAINPNTVKFREFPEWVKNQNFTEDDKKNKNIAMFCTGGIRCEKASSMMLKDGFKNVSHLKGGILNYFESVSQENSLWKGECFVFDDRVSVKHDLSEGTYDMCHGCRMPITELDKTSEKYIRGVACPNCYESTTNEQKKRYLSRQKQVDLAKKRNQKHIGPKDEVQKFKK
ncbi:rhodanese-related sulfurtransferase [Gammaproteobacteria bacterium]|nr:rhodanese-related sulfurtransferase [Gammaproteobacteria bacterium]MDC6460074.1 rhodanese-related sulfurtransferase [Gammaproteobacteria bacterium]